MWIDCHDKFNMTLTLLSHQETLSTKCLYPIKRFIYMTIIMLYTKSTLSLGPSFLPYHPLFHPPFECSLYIKWVKLGVFCFMKLETSFVSYFDKALILMKNISFWCQPQFSGNHLFVFQCKTTLEPIYGLHWVACLGPPQKCDDLST
jgi:hypothetical protein